MDLLKYLESMKNLPKRFSNLAFWRDVRKFKDEVVNAFEYVDSWGENLEHTIENVPDLKKLTLQHKNITRFITLSFTPYTGITNAKSGISFDKDNYQFDFGCTVPTTGVVNIQFYANTSSSSRSEYYLSVPVLLYPVNGQCAMYVREAISLHIPTTSTSPELVNISLHYFA